MRFLRNSWRYSDVCGASGVAGPGPVLKRRYCVCRLLNSPVAAQRAIINSTSDKATVEPTRRIIADVTELKWIYCTRHTQLWKTKLHRWKVSLIVVSVCIFYKKPLRIIFLFHISLIFTCHGNVYFQIHFVKKNIYILCSKLRWSWSQGYQLTKSQHKFDNGLAPSRRRDITWTNHRKGSQRHSASPGNW